MSKTTIKLNGKKKAISAGLTKADALYGEAGIESGEKRLYLEKSGDIDIPLLPDDYLIVHGDESIVVDDISSDIEDNPTCRNPVHFTFNGAKVEDGLEKAKISSKALCQRDTALEAPELFVDLQGQADDFIKDGLTLVVQEADSYFTIPSSGDDSVDLEACAKHGRKPPKGQKNYKIKIDGDKYKVERPELTGKEILALVGKVYEEWSLNEKLKGGRRKPIEPEEDVDFAEPGIERFETVKRQAQQG